MEWEKYTELLRFYVHFHKKLDSEVKQTRKALAELCEALREAPAPDLATGIRSRARMMGLSGISEMKRQGQRLTRPFRSGSA